MAFADRIDGKDVQVGDTICVVGSGSTIFHNMEVTTVTGEIVRARHINRDSLDSRTDTFSINAFWKFYLVERPKALPTHFGAKVVAEGEVYLNATPNEYHCWVTESWDWYSNEELSEKDWKEA